MDAFVHLVRGALGTGIVAMPKAFFYSGWLIGIFATAFIASAATYGILLMIRSQYLLCKRAEVPYMSYPKAFKMGLETGPPSLRCMKAIAV